jgi:hypothetical protein
LELSVFVVECCRHPSFAVLFYAVLEGVSSTLNLFFNAFRRSLWMKVTESRIAGLNHERASSIGDLKTKIDM